MDYGTKYLVEALEKIFTGLQEKGYKILPVSELIYTRLYGGSKGKAD